MHAEAVTSLMDANLNHEIHKEPQLVHVGPSKVEETFALESVEGLKRTEKDNSPGAVAPKDHRRCLRGSQRRSFRRKSNWAAA